ncbi:hypothetical protein [Mycobacterium kiyosense]
MVTDTIATRGERVVLNRVRTAFGDDRPDAFGIDVLAVVEIDSDEKILGRVVFDLDDFDAAIAKLDDCYLAGEAAPYARTWSAITDGYAALNRREIPLTTPDFVNIDHRPVAFAPGELTEFFRASWDLYREQTVYIEAVHRLGESGAVVIHAARGTSNQGLQTESRYVNLAMLDGEVCNRCEIFDESDLDLAIARFDQLSQPTPQLESAACQVYERFFRRFAARDWTALAQMYAEDICTDDRRQVVGSGTLRGREANVANMRAIAEAGTSDLTSSPIANRGTRITLTLLHSAMFQTDVLNLVEIDADERIKAVVVFDPDDVDAAFAELDARYRAGEAAPYLDTWSAINQGFAALNRRELFAATPDWVNINHRKGASIAPGEMPALLDAAWRAPSELSYRIVAAPRLNERGAVITHLTRETSHEGFQAEWRVISVIIFEGELVSRCEVFDEKDLDAALARFDELSRR